MKDCTSTTIAFTLTNIIQFGIIIKVITPPSVCHATCVYSAIVGATFLPSYITMEHIFASKLGWLSKIIFIFAIACTSFTTSIIANISLQYCFDKNWMVWLLQGSAIPTMFWTTYRMLFNKPFIHDLNY
jgi:hypothetical protein